MLLLAATAQAAEFAAHADVVSVEPIVRHHSATRRADACLEAPTRDRGLTALLQWDLATGSCRQIDRRETVDGFRVTYRWNGRLYTQVLASDPGPTLPVAVRVH